MQKILLKILNAFTHVRHYKIKKKHRYYISDNYYSRMYQLKYYLNDYIYKTKYKVISYRGEFQQELCFVLPFAYWHYLNGTLQKTISSKHTKELYFFSSNHEEVFEKRIWQYNNNNFEFPNMTHCISFNYSKWAQVPLKKVFSNSLFSYAKPILIIANKYNIEWDNKPLNYFDKTTLAAIIEKYGKKYQVIYNRPLTTEIISDNSAILDLDEFDWLKKQYPDVILMHDLFARHRDAVNNYNHLQLLVYANCQHFISVHGGTAALCSYFGGTNIIFSNGGLELVFNEFATIFPALSGAQILHAKTPGEVFCFLEKYY